MGLRSPAHGPGGYSLVELVTALAVTAVVAAVGVPRLSDFAAQYRLHAATQQLAVDLARARMKAIGENVLVEVRFGSQNFGAVGHGSTYQLRTSNDGLNYATVASATSVPSGVSFYAIPQSVTFNRQGMASGPLTIWAYNQRQQWRVVTVNSLGKVTVW